MTSRASLLKGEDGFQEVTRPSALAVPEKVRAEELREEGGECSVRVTGMEGAGRPREVSRTWQVIGGFCSVDIVGERWLDRAERRCAAAKEVGMQLSRGSELVGW